MTSKLKYIFPIIALILSFLVLEALKTTQATRQIDSLTYTLSDWTSQSEKMCKNDLAVMTSFIKEWETAHGVQVNVTLTSHEVKEDESIETHGAFYRSKLDYNVPTDERILNSKSGVVQVVVETTYSSNQPLFFWRSSKMKEVFLSKPRRSANVLIGCSAKPDWLDMTNL